MAFDRSKFLVRFVEEAREHVKKLNEGILTLEKHPDDADTLNMVFRLAHTIKGSARMMKLIAISDAAHKLEDVMDALRQNRISMSKELSDLFFEAIDIIEGMIDQIAGGEDVTEIPKDLCKRLEAAVEGKVGTEETTSAPDRHQPGSESPEGSPAEQQGPENRDEMPSDSPIKPVPTVIHEDRSVKTSETIRISADHLDELIKLMGEIVSGHNRSKQRWTEVREIEKLSEQSTVWLSLLEKRIMEGDGDKIVPVFKLLHEKINKLVLSMKEDISVQELLISDLQDRSLKMRMLPLSTIFDAFRRTVRDLCGASSKKIDFVVEGGETELDKKIIEKIGDSLLHMIRNSIEHGIEEPGERVKKGKAETGIIRLSAGYEGGSVVIRIEDDGSGISVRKIREKAVRKRLFDESAIESLPESEIINLIFRPGFSTTDLITDLSGRGVGMDVVKKNIVDDLKGSIQIKTAEGKGTSFHIRLPLTMAIIHVLLIRVSNMTFAVPINFIEEIVRIPRKELIDVVNKKAVRLHDQIIPIVRPDRILNLPAEEIRGDEDNLLMLVTFAGSEKLGVIIDALLEEEDVVIKPLPSHMRNLPFVSGVVISGKDEIFNVLHMPRIIEAAKELTAGEPPKGKPPADKKMIHILVVDDSVSTREIEKNILESYGYSVSLAGDGVEGFKKAKSLRYDLVITDVEMPRMDGFTLTKKLREEEEYHETPIILVTTRDREEDKKRGIMAGADAYIVKGTFDQETLLETVQNLIG